MSAIESIQLHPPVYIPEGMDGIRFPFDEASDIAITIGDSKHPRFRFARLIEHDTFVDLKDRAQEFPSPENDEFLPYDPVSALAYAELVPRTDHSGTVPRLMGMDRFVPFVPELGIKTVTDLATIPSETKDDATREQILQALLNKGSADCTPEEIAPKALERVVLDMLCSKYDACDPTKMVDIATLAPDMHLDLEHRMPVINALLGATTIYLLRAQIDLQRTGIGFDHFLQFTAGSFATIMRHLGYPSEPIAGLRKVFYDTDGRGIAMHANPLITPIAQLRETVLGAEEDSHLGKIATIYRQHFGEDV